MCPKARYILPQGGAKDWCLLFSCPKRGPKGPQGGPEGPEKPESQESTTVLAMQVPAVRSAPTERSVFGPVACAAPQSTESARLHVILHSARHRAHVNSTAWRTQRAPDAPGHGWRRVPLRCTKHSRKRKTVNSCAAGKHATPRTTCQRSHRNAEGTSQSVDTHGRLAMGSCQFGERGVKQNLDHPLCLTHGSCGSAFCAATSSCCWAAPLRPIAAAMASDTSAAAQPAASSQCGRQAWAVAAESRVAAFFPGSASESPSA